MKYKKGDKVVVKIDEEDVHDLNNGYDPSFCNKQLLGKLEDFTPAEKKIKMTVEEKKEFDRLCQNSGDDIADLFDNIADYYHIYPNLNKRLFLGTLKKNRKVQCEFVKALEKPSRIEVEKPEHEFKVGDLVKINGEKAIIIKIKKDVREPFKLILQDGSFGRASKNYIEFIKSNAINWSD